MTWTDGQQAAYDNLKSMADNSFKPVNTDQMLNDMFNTLIYGTLKSMVFYALIFGGIIAVIEGGKYLWHKKFSSSDLSKLS